MDEHETKHAKVHLDGVREIEMTLMWWDPLNNKWTINPQSNTTVYALCNPKWIDMKPSILKYTWMGSGEPPCRRARRSGRFTGWLG